MLFLEEMIQKQSLEGWGQLINGNKIANAAPRFIRLVLREMGMWMVGTPQVTAMLKVAKPELQFLGMASRWRYCTKTTS